MKILNCTPHALNLFLADGRKEEIPPCGIIPRIAEETVEDDVVDGINMSVIRNKQVENLPEPQDGVVLFVSKVCAAAAPHSKDLVFPRKYVRENGNIMGCVGLSRYTFE